MYLRVVCVVVGCDDQAATSAFNLTRDPPPHEARIDLHAIEALNQATARRLHPRSRSVRLERSSLVSGLKYQTNATAINTVNNQTSFLRERIQHHSSGLLQQPSMRAVKSDTTARSAERRCHWRTITASQTSLRYNSSIARLPPAQPINQLETATEAIHARDGESTHQTLSQPTCNHNHHVQQQLPQSQVLAAPAAAIEK